MNLYIDYTITYENSEIRSSKSPAIVNLTLEQYCRLVRAVKASPKLEDRTEIADIISEMENTVRWVDRWCSKNGALLSAPQKRPRKIAHIAFHLEQRALDRMLKYPAELLDRPEESATIVKSNGETCTIQSWFGEVQIRRGNTVSIFDTDTFLDRILW